MIHIVVEGDLFINNKIMVEDEEEVSINEFWPLKIMVVGEACVEDSRDTVVDSKENRKGLLKMKGYLIVMCFSSINVLKKAVKL